MWLRGNEVPWCGPYLQFIKRNNDLKQLVEGGIYRQTATI